MKPNLRGNAAAAAGEQLVVGLTYFAFYGLLIRLAGAEQVGVVSLVMVLPSLVSMTSTGFASALSHFLPVFEGQRDRIATIACVETTLLCTALLYCIALIVAFLPFQALIEAQVGPEQVSLVRAMMVPAVIQVFFLGVGATSGLALTALHRSDLRLWSTVAGGLIALAVLGFGAPRFGVVAALWGLAAQSAAIAVIGWLMLARILPGMPLLPRHIDRTMAGRLLSLGLNMQAQSLLVSGVEPVTRLLLGQFGSLSAVAYFSLANRFVLQMRALLYAAAQPVLPAFSHARAAGAGELAALYGRTEALMALAAVITFSAAAGAAPFIGEVWIGEREPAFVAFTIILAAGWFTNSLTLTAYFNAYSLGKMSPSLVGHVVLFVLNAAAGAILGWFYGAIGVVGGMGLALLLSSVALYAGNRVYTPLRSRELRLRRPVLVVSAGVVAATIAVSTYAWLHSTVPPLVGGVGAGFAWIAVMGPVLWFQPVAKTAWSNLRSRTAEPL